ncbi:MAG: hypothetical protein M0P12_11800 [Paludibacteraceae bacterium]|nr:hypothetical protein [Paludibacteraceae bacterium]
MKKKFLSLFAFVMMAITLCAQAPEKFSYQAVVRNNSGQLLIDKPIDLKIQIARDLNVSEVVYSETQQIKTNGNGLLSIGIGEGVSDFDFTSIDWSKGPFYMKSLIVSGSDSITITQQLLSVPFALYAKTAGNSVSKSYVDSLYNVVAAMAKNADEKADKCCKCGEQDSIANFVAFGGTDSKEAWYSYDGKKWFTASIPDSLNNFGFCVWLNNRYYAKSVGKSGFEKGHVLYSEDGIHWNKCNGIKSTDGPTKLLYNGEKYLLTTLSNAPFYESVDGINFTPVDNENLVMLDCYSAAYGNGKYLFLDWNNTDISIVSSTDLNTFSYSYSETTRQRRDLQFIYNKFYYSPTGTNYVYASEDGVDWEKITTYSENVDFSEFSVGKNGTTLMCDRYTTRAIKTTDGINWIPFTAPCTTGETVSIQVDGVWYFPSAEDASIYISSDLANYEKIELPAGVSNRVEGLCSRKEGVIRY